MDDADYDAYVNRAIKVGVSTGLAALAVGGSVGSILGEKAYRTLDPFSQNPEFFRYSTDIGYALMTGIPLGALVGGAVGFFALGIQFITD